MEIVALRAYAGGYRGCLVDDGAYLFFQFSHKGRLKRLKSYARDEFSDHDHFSTMMMKFMMPSDFLQPPVAVKALTLDELERVHTLKKTVHARSGYISNKESD